jgi:hypothetical protein
MDYKNLDFLNVFDADVFNNLGQNVLILETVKNLYKDYKITVTDGYVYISKYINGFDVRIGNKYIKNSIETYDFLFLSSVMFKKMLDIKI